MGAATRYYDVVVVGSGAVGSSIARALSPTHDVLVLEQGRIGGGTSSRATGMITPISAYKDLPRWGQYAYDSFCDFDGTGIFDFHPLTKVKPILPESAETYRAYADRTRATVYSVDEARDEYPGLFDDLSDYVGIVEMADVGEIDIDSYIFTLKHEAEKQGAVFHSDTTVTDVVVEDGEVAGVETEYGEVNAPKVVCAAGFATKALLAGIVDLPLKPFVWNAVYLDVDGDLGPPFPCGRDSLRELYWQQTTEGIVVGSEHFLDDPETDSKLDEGLVDVALNELPELINGLENASVLKHTYCPAFDCSTPDADPIIDAPSDAPDGLVVAAGCHGAGVMTSPSIGEAVRSLVTGDETDLPVEHFSLDRFESRSDDFEIERTMAY